MSIDSQQCSKNKDGQSVAIHLLLEVLIDMEIQSSSKRRSSFVAWPERHSKSAYKIHGIPSYGLDVWQAEFCISMSDPGHVSWSEELVSSPLAATGSKCATVTHVPIIQLFAGNESAGPVKELSCTNSGGDRSEDGISSRTQVIESSAVTPIDETLEPAKAINCSKFSSGFKAQAPIISDGGGVWRLSRNKWRA